MSSEKNVSPTTEPVLQYVKLTEHALTPTKGSVKSAGYDLRSAHEVVIPARGKNLVDKRCSQTHHRDVGSMYYLDPTSLCCV
jgi:dUTPase